jgi:hypothetical protein
VTRAPFQVLVFPYRLTFNNEVLYAIFKRNEHTGENYEDAQALLRCDSNKNALWELNYRLKKILYGQTST